ncbi:Olfactory receptor 10G7 [Varanus komodoensis]|uniref:olfactory receptor 10G7-like n=1 Tax=Varanus komodoensis TaxID=61221 RepID=UPI001CF76EB9|nr:olfactory receptor 10G7-like [Varanus komodoensis]KAF7235752.1 Olfactory receptor 10G7 [Varanus komodoensis]
MEPKNQTEVHLFILGGLPNTAQLPLLFFLIFLVIYLLTVLGNLLILFTILLEPRLHGIPMYFFLCNLSFLDTCLSTVTVPKILAGLIRSSDKTISFGGCVIQLYAFHFLASAECFLYTVMAYDRYLAICHPLTYAVLMNGRIYSRLAAGIWFLGSFHAAIHTSLTFHLSYCGPNKVDYFFCDIPPVLKLACADTAVNHTIILADIGVVATSCFALVCLSYAHIASAILKIQTTEGRHRAISTCSSHLIVVLLYYGPPVFIYTHPSSSNTSYETLAVFYTIITPMLNPFIYTLRNKEFKRALRKLFDGHGLSQDRQMGS